MSTDWDEYPIDLYNLYGCPPGPGPNRNSSAQPQSVRQILLGETNPDLLWLYFNVLMVDNITPALDETGQQPYINAWATGWTSNNIGVLQGIGFGRYRAALNPAAVSSLGIILSRYIGTNTLECFGESVEVIQNYRQSNIFNNVDSPTLLSYVTLSEAETYFSTRLKSRHWDCASETDKLKSLCTATKDIDQLAFQGVKTSEYRYRLKQFYIPGDVNDPYIGLSWVQWIAPVGWQWDDRRCNQSSSGNNWNTQWEQNLATNPWRQDLEFPRNGSQVVPNAIKLATCEIAITYLSGFDFELEIQGLNVIHQAFSGVTDSFDRRFVAEHIRAGINNAKAWIYLRPYLRDPKNFRLTRIS